MREWSDEELERYSRQIILEEIGIEGQEKLLNSSVLIIGLGGLGSVAALYLAAAGVGRIGVADFDHVDVSNLQRQIAHKTSSIGKNKSESAKEAMLAINPHIVVEAIKAAVDKENILALINEYEFVIDASDNFAAKFLINDACIMLKKPYSHGAVVKFSGRTTTVEPRKSACFACSFDFTTPPKSSIKCSTAGVLGAAAGVIGSLQAAEAIKYLTGAGELLSGRFIEFDAKNMRFRELTQARNPHCRVCGEGVETKLGSYEQIVCDVK